MPWLYTRHHLRHLVNFELFDLIGRLELLLNVGTLMWPINESSSHLILYAVHVCNLLDFKVLDYIGFLKLIF